MPGWLSEVEPEGAEAEEAEVPEWLARVRERQEQEAGSRPAPAEPEEEDWLGRLREGKEEPEREEEPSFEPPSPAAERPAFQERRPEEEPDWRQAWPAPPKPEDRRPSPPQPLPEPPVPARQVTPPRGLDRPSEPAWLSDVSRPLDEGLPHVPALVADESGSGLPAEEADIELGSIDLPDWLSEMKGQAPGARPEPQELADSLAPATLPAWLEAMRPMETFRPVVEIQQEEDQAVESAGPLAGLRGVLLAEPLVAMPRQTTSAAARLSVTERQFALGDLLRRMVEDEEREIPPRAVARRRLPLVRWAVAIALILAVALPSFSGGPSFSVPTLVPPGLPALVGLVDTLPVERPVLLVFDYEPAFAGEIEAVSGSLIEHMVGRGLRLATVSTRPTGPALAERMLRRMGATHPYENGRDYLHLGFIPGGSAAVQLFAQSPHQAVAGGYLVPEGLDERRLWESPILAATERLSDFGAVVVLAAGTEIARTWVEQAHPWLGDTPLIMVLSAGIEPLIRPYYEALNPQVDGILAGMPAAVAYEQALARSAEARALWTPFGMGILVAELALMMGGIYGLASMLIRPGGG
jgi:hypothetical protein